MTCFLSVSIIWEYNKSNGNHDDNDDESRHTGDLSIKYSFLVHNMNSIEEVQPRKKKTGRNVINRLFGKNKIYTFFLGE